MEPPYTDLARYVLTRGLALCALLLAGTAALLLRSGEPGAPAIPLLEAAEAFQSAALSAFGCATVGSLLAEDTVRHC